MPHVSVLDKGEYLLLTCAPCHDADDWRACIDGMCDALELFGKSKVLADFTATPEPIPIMGPPRGRRLPKHFAKHGLLLAVVARHGVVDTDSLRDHIVTRNRAVNLSVFVDLDSALAWLSN